MEKKPSSLAMLAARELTSVLMRGRVLGEAYDTLEEAQAALAAQAMALGAELFMNNGNLECFLHTPEPVTNKSPAKHRKRAPRLLITGTAPASRPAPAS